MTSASNAASSILPQGDYTVRLGDTFASKQPKTTFSTLRYDFKPASVADSNEQTYTEINPNTGAVDLMIPTNVSAEARVVDLQLFKGSKKPEPKECVIIWNHETNEMVLERLSSKISVKAVRGQPPTAEQLEALTMKRVASQKKNITQTAKDSSEIKLDKVIKQEKVEKRNTPDWPTATIEANDDKQKVTPNIPPIVNKLSVPGKESKDTEVEHKAITAPPEKRSKRVSTGKEAEDSSSSSSGSSDSDSGSSSGSTDSESDNSNKGASKQPLPVNVDEKPLSAVLASRTKFDQPYTSRSCDPSPRPPFHKPGVSNLLPRSAKISPASSEKGFISSAPVIKPISGLLTDDLRLSEDSSDEG